MKSNKQKIEEPTTPKAGKGRKHQEKTLPKYLLILVLAGILILTTMLYWPMLSNQFSSWDDPDYITKNNVIKSMSSENIKTMFTQPIAQNYHPLTFISLALNYSVSKLNPYSYYLTNLLLHLLNCFLVFRFIMLLSKDKLHVALFTTLIFAVHPMHVESVAWATERKDVLYTLFYLLALNTWLHFIETKHSWQYILTLVLTLFSMLSKPAAIILPAVLMLVEWYRTQTFSIKEHLNKIPFFLLSAVFLYVTLKAQQSNNMVVGDFVRYTVVERALFACFGFMIYLIKFVVPYQLAIIHPYAEHRDALLYLGPLVILGLLTCIAFFKEQRKILIFGSLFYLINLVLVLQFVSIGDSLFSERYTYVPYIAVAFVVGTLLFDRFEKQQTRVLWPLLGIFILFLSVTAHSRVKVWHNGETLWNDQVEKYPKNDIGYYLRAIYFSESNQKEKAVVDYDISLKIRPDEAIFNDRGVVLWELHRNVEAIADFTRSIDLNPMQYKAYLGRGYAQFDEKHYEEAMQDVETALQHNSNYDGYFFRARVHAALLHYDEAIRDYTTAIGMTPNASAYNNRGSVYTKLKQYEKAIADYNESLKIDPQNPNCYANRGGAYFRLNQIPEALADLNKGVSMNPKNSICYYYLALLYEQQGDKAKAFENAKKSIELGTGFSPDILARLGIQ